MLFFDMILKVSKAGSNVYIVPEYQVYYDLKSGTMDDGSGIETTTGNIQDVQLNASLLAEKETNFTLFPNPGSDFIEIKSKIMKFFTILILSSVLICCGKINKRAVEGHVMNPITGLPIEGVKMSLVKTTNGLPGGEKTIGSALTDANGYYKIEEKSMKAVYLQVNTFGNYYPIGWFKDGSYSGGNNFPIEKGDVQTVDFHAVPFGELILSINNINCQGITDSMQFNSIYQYGTDDGYSTWRTG